MIQRSTCVLIVLFALTVRPALAAPGAAALATPNGDIAPEPTTWQTLCVRGPAAGAIR
jgi:hypothetical protein